MILAKDLNFSGWNWNPSSLRPNSPYVGLHEELAAFLDYFGLTQKVNEQTRGQNTLDLIMTNIPELVNRVHVIPGISDHNIPMRKSH